MYRSVRLPSSLFVLTLCGCWCGNALPGRDWEVHGQLLDAETLEPITIRKTPETL